ncbi:MerR family transcriptional regulator [Anaerolentibacter hominis]|uniref:MerR family transcriptional regulator n=1 Tax=Anaerolentibacter hominis TaxID=3079009 RepID=UPI0031B80B78
MNADYYFTAGQFARLHHINKRTLHYYDEIGLFSPAYTGKNGYRYYTYQQSPDLEMLLALRELGVSIGEIKDYLKHCSAAALNRLITEKITEIDAAIRHLNQMKEIFTEKQQMLSLCEHTDLNQIKQITCPGEWMVLSPVSAGAGLDFAALMEHLHKAQEVSTFKKGCGSMISIEKVVGGNLDNYDYFFTRVDQNVRQDTLFFMPPGHYLMAFCVGDWDNLPYTYTRIIAYAEQNGLSLTGYAYEEGMNEMAIQDMKEYITRILIRYET